MFRLRLVSGSLTLIATASLFATAATAPAAVTPRQAGERAVEALGLQGTGAPAIVFRAGTLGSGAVVSEAGGAAAPRGRTGKLGVANTSAQTVIRVQRGRRAFAFYADLAPHKAYAHAGRIALVDAGSGTVRLSRTLHSPPLINGRQPAFQRSAAAYNDPKHRVWSAPYTAAQPPAARATDEQGAFGYRVDRAPTGDLGLAKRVADQLAADRVCALRVSDTFGEFYDFTGADRTRARLGDLFYTLAQLNNGFVDRRYSRTSGRSPIAELERMIERRGCRELLVYVAGRGFSAGAESVVAVGTRVRGRRVHQQLVKATELRAAMRRHPQVGFSVVVDAPYTRGLARLLAKEPNARLVQSSAGEDGSSFGYLPSVVVGGKLAENRGNPEGLLEFTNGTLTGIERFLTSAAEVDAAFARQGGQRSLLALMFGRAFELGAPQDLPQTTGLRQPFFAATTTFPKPPAAPDPVVATPPAPPVNTPPVASSGAITTAEDTPAAILLGGADADGDALQYAVTTAPEHGTLSGSGAGRTYTPAPDFSGADSVGFTVNDGRGGSASAFVTITVTAVNDAPVVVVAGSPVAFTEGGGPVALDGSAQVGDVDSAQLTGATVRIVAGASPDDVLAASPPVGIAADYDVATHTLRLSGSASIAAYESALRSVTFAITGANPLGGTRTLRVTATDGDAESEPETRAIEVNTVNDPPVLGAVAGAVNYTENGTGVAPAPAVTAADPDSPNLVSARIAISGGVPAEDRLLFDSQGGITGAYDAATSVLALTGSATVADYETALRSVRYANTSDDPSTATRTIAVRVNDGDADSTAVSADVNVIAVDDLPVVTLTQAAVTYTEGDAPVAIDPAATVTDAEGDAITALVLTRSGLRDEDTVSYTESGVPQSSSGRSTITINGSWTPAEATAIVRSIRFAAGGDDAPSTAARSLAVGAAYGGATPAGASVDARNITVVAVNDAPVLTASGASPAYTENGAAVAVDPAITVADADSTTLTGASVTLGAGDGNDELVYSAADGITGSYDAGERTLTLTGDATPTQYQAALRRVRFAAGGDDPSTAARSVAFTVNDGALDSNEATGSVSVTAVPDAPSVTTTPGTSTFTEGGAAVVVDDGLTVTDPDSSELSAATVQITGNLNPGDTLGLTAPAPLAASWNPATGTLVITGNASPAAYTAALRLITFSAGGGDDPSTATRTITFTATDAGALNSTPATRAVAVAAVNDAPQLSVSAGGVAYTENAAPVALASDLAISDPDSTELSGATITLSDAVTGDALHFTNTPEITGSFNAATFVMTLTGDATLAQYQAALRTVAFATPSDNPVTAPRTATFTVTDGGGATSAPQTRTVTVTPVNDAPSIVTSAGEASYAEAAAPALIDAGLLLSDPDSTLLTAATVTISSGYQSGDELDASASAGIAKSYDAATGVLTLTGSATLATYESVLRSVTYASARTNLPNGTRTITVAATDDAAATGTGSRVLRYHADNDPPVLGGTGTPVAFTEGDAPVAVLPAITVADSDDAELSRASVQITAGLAPGDVLTLDAAPGFTSSYDALTGTLTVTAAASPAGFQAALRGVRFGNPRDDLADGARTLTVTARDASGGDSDAITETLNVAGANDAPAVTTSAGTVTYREDDAPVVIDAALTATDVDPGTEFTGASVTITGAATGERLALAAGTSVPAAITVTGTGTATLTLSGAATPAAYQALLAAVTFAVDGEVPAAGTRSVGFQVSDGLATSAVATRGVVLEPVNDAPVAVADTITTDEDTAKTQALTVNDTDADHTTAELSIDQLAGQTVTVGNAVTLPSGASVTLTAAGTVSYDPSGSFDALAEGGPNGADSFSYRIKDAAGATSASVTTTVVITPVNDAPRPQARSIRGAANVALEYTSSPGLSEPKVQVSGSLLTGATDVDGPAGEIVPVAETVASSSGGDVTITAAGGFVYRSQVGETDLVDTFTFRLRDTHGDDGQATVTVSLAERVWFVDNGRAGSTGRSDSPFQTLAPATAAAVAGDRIFVAEGSAPYAGGAGTLKANGALIGGGTPWQVDVSPTGTPELVQLAPAGDRPMVNVASGTAGALSTGSLVRGIDVTTSATGAGFTAASATGVQLTDVAIGFNAGSPGSGHGLSFTGSAVTLSNVDVATSPAAATAINAATTTLSAGNGSTINAAGGRGLVTTGGNAYTGTLAFDSVTAAGGIALGTNVAFGAPAGTLRGVGSGTALAVTTGDQAISYGGAITPEAGQSGIAISGRSGGSVTIPASVTVNGGTALRVSSSSAGTVTSSGALTASGSGAAVELNDSTGGSITVSGAITTTGDSRAVRATGNTGTTITISGKLTASGTQKALEAANNIGGSLTLSAAGSQLASTNNDAVSLTGNSATTAISFTGATLAVRGFGSGRGFNATGAGTVTVSGSASTLASQTGTALNLSGVSSAGITWQSVSAAGAPNGIALTNVAAVGSGTVALSVLGDGSATRNATGGTISAAAGANGATTGTGVRLENTGPVSLSHLDITGSVNHGVWAKNVAGLTLRHGTVDLSGDTSGGPNYEGNVRLINLTGSSTITNNDLSGGQNDNVYLSHETGTATVDVTNNLLAIDPDRPGVQNDAVLADGNGDASANLTLRITGNGFGSEAAGDAIQVAPTAAVGAEWKVEIANNTVVSPLGGAAGGEDLGGGITVNPSVFNGTFSYRIQNNQVSGVRDGGAINVSPGSGSGTLHGVINANTIGTAGVVGSGSQRGSGLVVDTRGTGTHRVSVTNNTIHGYSLYGMELNVGGTGMDPSLQATVQNNTVGTPTPDATETSTIYGVYVNVGVNTLTKGQCLAFTGNMLAGSGNPDTGGGDLRLSHRRAVPLTLPGYAGPPTDTAAVDAFLAGANTTSTRYVAPLNGGTFINGTCLQPIPLP